MGSEVYAEESSAVATMPGGHLLVCKGETVCYKGVRQSDTQVS